VTAPHPRGVVPALLGVQLAFATLSIVGKVTLAVVPPLALVAVRLAGGAAVFALAAAGAGRSLVPPRGERWTFVRLALLGLVVNQALFSYGLARTTAINATVLIATIPMLTAVYAVASGRERGQPRVWLGALVAFAGVVIVARPERLSLGDRTLVGNALVLANCVAYSAYLVQARAAVARHGAPAVLTWIFVAAAAIAAPVGLPLVAAHSAAWSARHWMALGYIVAAPTVFAYGANAWALARAPSSLVAVFIYVQPALAVVLALTLGDHLAGWLGVAPPRETLTVQAGLGMLAIFAGVYVAAHRR
jgi:drug/metabolite transporter (DMT)-like permease